MFTVGMIGAGNVSARHIEAYQARQDCCLKSIADLNEEQLLKRANQYKIENAYTDYHEILNDDEIDAVAIVTPTFTHKNIVIESLRAGKHVICEKPPTRTAAEAIECMEAAKKYGKLLMYTFVFRFSAETQYLKKYAEAGKFGQIVSVEVARTSNCSAFNGWMRDKEKFGGMLLDGAIHELDSVLYIMGYPKVKSVTGFSTYINKNLPEKMNGVVTGYQNTDTSVVERTTDSGTTGYLLFENGASLYIRSGNILNVTEPGAFFEIVGEKAGAKVDKRLSENSLKLLEISDDNYFRNVYPNVGKINEVQAEVAHFVDCCLNGTECICKVEEAVSVMQIIDAIYKSAETGETIYFN